ncbi:MAG: dTMP kinase [Verrucomicrobiota bacterium]|nr:dTMP kinase [Verrucomicrobiota bacterium]
MRGLFITFEGTEGCGKSTQIARLAERLKSIGHKVLVLREPGGTAIGEEIRHLLKNHPAGERMFPETELLLMNASRAQLVREVILPARGEGAVILCDRFYDSTVAYQVFGRQLEPKEVADIIDFAIAGTRPDLTLVLRVPLGVSEGRRAERGGKADRFEAADRGFFQRVEQGYREIAETEGPRVREIDGSKSVEEVEAEIWRWVDPLVHTLEEQGSTVAKSIGEEEQRGLRGVK